MSSPKHPDAGTIRLARRCWVDPASAATLDARCAAALHTSARYTVVASVTAATLHGMWLPPELLHDIHLATATPGRDGRLMTRTRRPEFVPHRFQLRTEDIVVHNGLAVTSLARTWRDLAGVLNLAQLVAAGDSALRAGTTTEEMDDVIAAAPLRAFTRRARTAHALLDARSRSRPESHMRVAISTPALPRFDCNVAVYRALGGWLGEPDLSLAEARLALEYQGEDHAELRRMRRDLSRFKDFRDEQWEVLPYGPAEVFGRPWEIAREVYDSVSQRAPHLLRG